MPDAVQPEALVGMLGNYAMGAAYAGWTPAATDRQVDLAAMLPTIDHFIALMGTPTDPMERMRLRDLTGLRDRIAGGPMSSGAAHLLMQQWYLPLRAGEAPDAGSMLAYIGNGLFEGLNAATGGRYGEAVFGSNELPSLDPEAQRLRMLEEAAGGSIGFWRALGRALVQGASLGWGDEFIAWWDSQWQGTEFRDEWARQQAIIGILQGANPLTFAFGQFAGGLATQLGATALVGWGIPALAGPTAWARMGQVGLASTVTGAASLAGASQTGDDRGLRALAGAAIHGPFAALGPGFLAPWWLQLKEPVRKLVAGILGGTPGSIAQVPFNTPESFRN